MRCWFKKIIKSIRECNGIFCFLQLWEKRVQSCSKNKTRKLPRVSWFVSHIIFFDWIRNIRRLLPTHSYWIWTYKCHSDVFRRSWNRTWKKIHFFYQSQVYEKEAARGGWLKVKKDSESVYVRSIKGFSPLFIVLNIQRNFISSFSLSSEDKFDTKFIFQNAQKISRIFLHAWKQKASLFIKLEL